MKKAAAGVIARAAGCGSGWWPCDHRHGPVTLACDKAADR
ncbi:hypothetical protein GGR48_000857 [Sphingomonas pseudosanguinis]|uniref:Uncharacterized protein n=1 Tax=Sphingomonas pseudosanguinis TaxID=413712 RepID=A0A7W6F1Z4_9SPHN|nr:hypothetical protein [Sphingomonas pseudosanguinis]